jgi:tryptophan synthase alpha chain
MFNSIRFENTKIINQLKVTITQIAYFQRLKDLKLRNPFLIGFGISDHNSFRTASQYASGAIIGSAFIKMLGQSQSLRQDILSFVAGIRGQAILSPVS